MPRTITVAHSPDSDDAFMFYALAEGKIDTGGLRYTHELQDIQSLNERALKGELEITAVSVHAYAYLADQYAVLSSGSSMGDGYGPRLVALTPKPADPRAALQGLRVAIPGKLTTACCALLVSASVRANISLPQRIPRPMVPQSSIPVAIRGYEVTRITSPVSYATVVSIAVRPVGRP